MSLKICPHCKLRVHKLCGRCHCGYDFSLMKIIPFASAEERDLVFGAEEKAAFDKARKIAKREMIAGGTMCAVGIAGVIIQSFITSENPSLNGKISLTPILLGLGVFIKGLLNYLTREAEEFS